MNTPLLLLIGAAGLAAVVGLGVALRRGVLPRLGRENADGGTEIRRWISRYREAEQKLLVAGKTLAARRTKLDARIEELRMEKNSAQETLERRLERSENIRRTEDIRRHLDRVWQRRMVLSGHLPMVILQRRVPPSGDLPMAGPQARAAAAAAAATAAEFADAALPPPGDHSPPAITPSAVPAPIGAIPVAEPGAIGTGPDLAARMTEAATTFRALADRGDTEAKLLATENPKDDPVAMHLPSSVRGAQADRKSQNETLLRFSARMRKVAARFEQAAERANANEMVFDAFFRGVPDQIETERREAEDRVLEAEQIGNEDLETTMDLIQIEGLGRPAAPGGADKAGGAGKASRRAGPGPK